MLQIDTIEEARELFKALGSDVRIDIVKYLQIHPNISMKELAAAIGITNGALTAHIQKLESAGVVRVSQDSTVHGNQKLLSLAIDKLLVNMEPPKRNENVVTADIKVGQYSDFHVYPTCGLSTPTEVIGEVDDPRYFAHTDHYKADILWFMRGYVEYMIPNFVPKNNRITSIKVSAEISSEAPGVNENWPSDITISVNGTEVGMWTSPGDFGERRGILTPDWWFSNWNQYGLLKVFDINSEGTFVDGFKISDVTMDDLDIDPSSQIRFRFSVEDDAKHVGGLTIFGRTFGNYAQDIKTTLTYEPVA